MTKLNYGRPYFRLMDNLRREFNREHAGALPVVRPAPHRAQVTSKPGRVQALQLSVLEIELALELFNALDSYLDASSNVFKALGPGKKRRLMGLRERLAAAEIRLVDAAKRCVSQMLLAKSSGNKSFLTWYRQLEGRFTESPGVWDILNNFAMKHAVDAVHEILER
ncbi:hypothetical protein ACNRBS_01465 [Ralstonia pseudosolanacearum]|uniref:hypothetical protein n=1 Tax=Ralstonia pseudosolanacearum TaxID=1310165 RepID=UPI003AAFAFFE